MALPEGYLDAYIDQCPGYGWQGGPSFQTTIVTMRNGRERRNAEWSKARHSFTMPFNNINQSGYIGIKQMHLSCMGRLRAFKFVDQLDYQAVNEVFAEGNGVQTEFQLRKVSTIDGVSYIRDTYVIQADSVFRVNGTPAAHTIDLDRGLVTFAAPPANLSAISGSWLFGLWVRFDQDDLPFSIDSRSDDTPHINGSVSLIEVPPPPDL